MKNVNRNKKVDIMRTLVFDACSIQKVVLNLKRFSAIMGIKRCEGARVTFNLKEQQRRNK